MRVAVERPALEKLEVEVSCTNSSIGHVVVEGFLRDEAPAALAPERQVLAGTDATKLNRRLAARTRSGYALLKRGLGDGVDLGDEAIGSAASCET